MTSALPTAAPPPASQVHDVVAGPGRPVRVKALREEVRHGLPALQFSGDDPPLEIRFRRFRPMSSRHRSAPVVAFT